MKAVVLHGPGRYAFESDWIEPYERDWVMVRVHHCGICGSDLPRYAVAGSYKSPMILGHEFSGVVEIPVEGSSYSKGEPVAVLPLIPCGKCTPCRNNDFFHCTSYRFLGSRDDGGMAEYCAVPLENLVRLPSMDLLRQGSLIEPLAVAHHVVERSGFLPGARAVVLGAGPIGLLVGLWLLEAGAVSVTMADIREGNLAIARRMGFADVRNLKNSPLSGTPSFDFAYEAAGSGKALSDAILNLEDHGTLTLVGRDTIDTTLSVSVVERMMRKELNLNGCWGYRPGTDMQKMVQLIEKHSHKLLEMITHDVSAEDACRTIDAMIRKEFDYCKVIVTFQER